MRRVLPIALLVATAVFLVACGGGSSSSSGSSNAGTEAGERSAAAKTPEEVWAKEVEAVMRKFENSSAKSVEAIHTLTSRYTLEPTYARYAIELEQLGKWLDATDPPVACKPFRERMGELAGKVSNVIGVLAKEPKLSPEEFTALSAQQMYKFARVGRQLTKMTIHPHC